MGCGTYLYYSNDPFMKRYGITIALFFLASGLFAQKEGWTSLFDGKTLTGWKRLAGTAEYTVENGAIVGLGVAGSGNSFLATEKEFENFILEMDVKIDDTTSNSGIQLRSHYDPNGHEGKGLVFGYQYEIDPSSRRWTGGIYDEGRRGLQGRAMEPYPRRMYRIVYPDLGRWAGYRLRSRYGRQ